MRRLQRLHRRYRTPRDLRRPGAGSSTGALQPNPRSHGRALVDYAATVYEFRWFERARTAGRRAARAGDEVWRRGFAWNPADAEGHARGPGRTGGRLAPAHDRAA